MNELDDIGLEAARRADTIGCGWSTQGGGMPSLDEASEQVSRAAHRARDAHPIAARRKALLTVAGEAIFAVLLHDSAIAFGAAGEARTPEQQAAWDARWAKREPTPPTASEALLSMAKRACERIIERTPEDSACSGQHPWLVAERVVARYKRQILSRDEAYARLIAGEPEAQAGGGSPIQILEEIVGRLRDALPELERLRELEEEVALTLEKLGMIPPSAVAGTVPTSKGARIPARDVLFALLKQLRGSEGSGDGL